VTQDFVNPDLQPQDSFAQGGLPQGRLTQDLLPQTVDLWWMDLTLDPAQGNDLEADLALLDDQEQARANRLRQPHHRDRFILAHGQVRRVLARYLRQLPQAIQFCRGNRGKPAVLCQKGGPPPLQFNLSHSGDTALLGVSRSPVGVDVEQLRSLPDSLSMAQRFFSEKEFIFLQSLHESERTLAFFKHWVCKEAFVKATGEGLVEQLHQVVVNLGPEIVWDALPERDLNNWQLQCFVPSTQTVAAVVVRQQSPLQVRWCRLPQP
jgi:4'-phosphopantetheinyl transferase